jgi:ATP-dependent DNA ligase
MAAQPVTALLTGDEWLYELKLDGYRALLLKDGSKLTLRSRNQKDLTQMYATVASAGRGLKAKQAVVDGEIVAMDASGRPSFQALQHRSLIVDRSFDVRLFHSLLHADLSRRTRRLPNTHSQPLALLLYELPFQDAPSTEV